MTIFRVQRVNTAYLMANSRARAALESRLTENTEDIVKVVRTACGRYAYRLHMGCDPYIIETLQQLFRILDRFHHGKDRLNPRGSSTVIA